MSETDPGKDAAQTSPPKPALAVLGSLKFALAVIVLIALACVAGTLIPQGSQVDALVESQPDAHSVMRMLSKLGMTHIFSAWWFVLLLFLFAASLMACTRRRYRVIAKTTGAVRARVIGSFVTHVSLLLVIAGGVVRVLWSQKGTLELHEGDTVTQVASPDGTFPLPFSVRLAKFDLEFYESKPAPAGDMSGHLLLRWADKKIQEAYPIDTGVARAVRAPDEPKDAAPAFTVTVLQYVPDFMIDNTSGEVKSRSNTPNNPAIQVETRGAAVTNTQWVFARFPDFASHGSESATAMPLEFRFVMASASAMARGGPSIKAFKSTVEILENGAVVRRQVIAVNSPFTHRGYTFYQLSYNPEDLTWSSQQVVKDPSVLIVYAGFLLMMVGLTIVFCVGPWLDAQRGQTGGAV